MLQVADASTVTHCWLVGPFIVPPPEIDQEYADIPAGPQCWVAAPGQTVLGPPMEQVGGEQQVVGAVPIAMTLLQPLPKPEGSIVML